MDKLPEKGLVGLAYWDLGFRQIHTTKKPIAKADDLKGVKMRVIPTQIYVDFMNALGANAVPMPFTETYGALEQGAIDGMTNPLLNILDGKYNEVTRSTSRSPTICTRRRRDSQQEIRGTSCRPPRRRSSKTRRPRPLRSSARSRATKRQRCSTGLKTGMTVTSCRRRVAKLREKAKPVIAKHTKTVGEEIVNETNAELAKLRAGKK